MRVAIAGAMAAEMGEDIAPGGTESTRRPLMRYPVRQPAIGGFGPDMNRPRTSRKLDMDTASPTRSLSRCNSLGLKEEPEEQKSGSFVRQHFDAVRVRARSLCECVGRNPALAMVATGLPILGTSVYALTTLPHHGEDFTAMNWAALLGSLVMQSVGGTLTIHGLDRCAKSCPKPSDCEDSTDAEDPDASGGPMKLLEKSSEDLDEVLAVDSDTTSEGLQSLDRSDDSKELPQQECDE